MKKKHLLLDHLVRVFSREPAEPAAEVFAPGDRHKLSSRKPFQGMETTNISSFAVFANHGSTCSF